MRARVAEKILRREAGTRYSSLSHTKGTRIRALRKVRGHYLLTQTIPGRSSTIFVLRADGRLMKKLEA